MGYWGGLAASWLREARDRASIILANSELGGSLEGTGMMGIESCRVSTKC